MVYRTRPWDAAAVIAACRLCVTVLCTHHHRIADYGIRSEQRHEPVDYGGLNNSIYRLQIAQITNMSAVVNITAVL